MDGTRLKIIERSWDIDVLSYLPCNVIHNVLKYLPLRDAVRTSILSRGWRYKWVNIPYLVFDQEFQASLVDCRVESVIFQILLFHKGPILKFKIKDLDLDDHHLIDPWSSFLSNHPLEELTLDLWDSPHPLMPSMLSSFHELRHLQLRDCELKPRSSFEGLNKLVTLDLEYVKCVAKDLGRFISSCPSLEHLRLWFLILKGRLEIRAPGLKSFTFCDGLDSVASINCPLLTQFSFKGSTDDCAVEFMVVELHAKEHDRKNVKFLGQSNFTVKFDHHILESLAFLYCGAQTLMDSLSHLRILVLHDVYFEDVRTISNTISLIRNFRNLRYLIVTVNQTPFYNY